MNHDDWGTWKVITVKMLGGLHYGVDAPLPNEEGTRVHHITINDNIVSIFATRDGSAKRPYRRFFSPSVKYVVRADTRANYEELLQSIDDDVVYLDRCVDMTGEEWEVDKPWPKAYIVAAIVCKIVENHDGTVWCFCLPEPGSDLERRQVAFVVELLPFTVIGVEGELAPNVWERALAGALEGTQDGQVNVNVDLEPETPDGETEEEEEDEEEETEAATLSEPTGPAEPEVATFGTPPPADELVRPSGPIVTTPQMSLSALDSIGADEPVAPTPNGADETTTTTTPH